MSSFGTVKIHRLVDCACGACGRLKHADEDCRGDLHPFRSKFGGEIKMVCDTHYQECKVLEANFMEAQP